MQEARRLFCLFGDGGNWPTAVCLLPSLPERECVFFVQARDWGEMVQTPSLTRVRRCFCGPAQPQSEDRAGNRGSVQRQAQDCAEGRSQAQPSRGKGRGEGVCGADAEGVSEFVQRQTVVFCSLARWCGWGGRRPSTSRRTRSGMGETVDAEGGDGGGMVTEGCAP